MDPKLLAELVEITADLAKTTTRLAQFAKKLSDYKPQSFPVWDGPPEYVDTKQAAKVLGLSSKTLEGLRLRGAGPKFIRIGRAIRYSLADLATMPKITVT